MIQLLSGLDDLSGISAGWGHTLTLDSGPDKAMCVFSAISGHRQNLALSTPAGS